MVGAFGARQALESIWQFYQVLVLTIGQCSKSMLQSICTSVALAHSLCSTLIGKLIAAGACSCQAPMSLLTWPANGNSNVTVAMLVSQLLDIPAEIASHLVSPSF